MAGFIRADRGARAPQHRPHFRAQLERLEARELLSGAAPTDVDQYMLALINRTRANPAAEGQRLVALAQADPTIHQATAGWDLNLFYRTISAYAPEPPLAFNPRLIDAALVEDASMVAQNSQRHSPAGFLTNPGVAVDSDGQAYYPTGSGGWATGENIFAFSQPVAGRSPTAYADYFEAGFLLDWGNPDFGHLRNILAPGPAEANPSAGIFPFNEVGVGLVIGVTPTAAADPNSPISGNQGLSVGPALVTQEFGWRQGNSFLTGTFFRDDLGIHLYAPNEGYGGVTITATGLGGQGTFQTQTWPSGGYSLPLPQGQFQVVATGNLPQASSTVITIGQDNVGWDVAFAPAAPPSIPAPPPSIPAPPPPNPQANGPTQNPSPSTKADLTVYGPDPVTGKQRFQTLTAATNYDPGQATIFSNNGYGFGNSRSIPVSADYFGDGKPAYAVWTPNVLGGMTFAAVSSSFKAGENLSRNFGLTTDIPVMADVDGDRKADFGVYGYQRGLGYRFDFLVSSRNFDLNQQLVFNNNGFGYGNGGSIPVVADFEGSGHAAFGLFNPSPTGSKFTFYSPFTNRSVTRTVGAPADIPIAVDFDGDRKADLALYGKDPASGKYRYEVLTSSTGFDANRPVIFDNYGNGYGNAASIPVVADFEGTGKADFAVFTPDNAGRMQFVYQASQVGHGVAYDFAMPTDIALLAPSCIQARRVRGS